MTMVDRLYEVGSQLPPPALAELLDFAEFLRQRNAPAHATKPVPLTELGGGLEDSVAFAGAPLAIQDKMRNEWT